MVVWFWLDGLYGGAQKSKSTTRLIFPQYRKIKNRGHCATVFLCLKKWVMHMTQSEHAAESNAAPLLKDHINRRSITQLAELIKRHQADFPIADFIEQANYQLESMPLKTRSEEHTSELQSRPHLVCRLL